MQDVQSPIDLTRSNDANAWALEAMVKRPYRAAFFKEITAQLLQSEVISILELGSGPGFLACDILNEIPAIEYSAYDFSDAMHKLAQERLGQKAARVNFIRGNFREPNWAVALGEFDAIVTLQAVHEVRHKSRTLALFKAVKSLLKERGIFLYCDHFYGVGAMQDSSLFMSSLEQEQCLMQAGFMQVNKLLSIGSLNLWYAVSASGDCDRDRDCVRDCD